ncbi:uncharacterized protein KY384_008654 [Bacidia gigantensis]|uniref:uncharacterized protein n=1 Tax=Bacidia gigantensis TaxID=2732470 RepID=UPI001D044D94|nr:uncharacterized protein KY384_008654 [Bacidia gigantensis]KAG8527224.1 hypothetical protein KY384_008654 [Bacidia gigantensis]
MPSTIAYDPSLVLANVVSLPALKLVDEISKAQAPIDAAEETLNALLTSKRSFDMTKTELTNLKIEAKDLDAAVEDLKKQIDAAGVDFAKKNVESPVDYVKTEIKTLPLAADTINMDVQYFSMDQNQESSGTYATDIAAFASRSASFLGAKTQTEISGLAKKQATSQSKKHSLAGTLVISVSCTHKNASVLAPFALNVDKGISVWNSLFKEKEEKLDPTNYKAMSEIAKKGEDASTKKYSILSGTTFGSSFVGMVHILNSTDTSISQSLSSVVGSLQAQMDAGSWLEKQSGGFGVNTSIGNEVKNLLSSQNITSHVTMICMGVIPSMVANDVKLGVDKFAQFDPASSMAAIATIQNATATDQDSVKAAAESARTGKQMISMKTSEIKSALSALGEIDDGANKVFDINSMMTALDDYLKKAAGGTAGVPINYYLKDITKNMLAEMWVAKYFPGQYMAIQHDDVPPANPAKPAAPKTDGAA